MYTEDTELRIKCLEIATTISGSTSDTHYFLMDSKRIYDFVLGKSDVVIDAALEEIRKFRENSGLGSNGTANRLKVLKS